MQEMKREKSLSGFRRKIKIFLFLMAIETLVTIVIFVISQLF